MARLQEFNIRRSKVILLSLLSYTIIFLVLLIFILVKTNNITQSSSYQNRNHINNIHYLTKNDEWTFKDKLSEVAVLMIMAI